MYKPKFIRKDYLDLSKEFERENIEDFGVEIEEFKDIEGLAIELAYTRYYLAKLEQIIDTFKKEVEKNE